MKSNALKKGLCILSLVSMTVSPMTIANEGNGITQCAAVAQIVRTHKIDSIDLEKLEEAKSLAAELDDNNVLFSIMDILREWKRVKAHRNKKAATERMITSALKQAADGRFKAAQFIINNVTDDVIADDQQAFDNGLLAKLKTAQKELDAFLARETVRTGKQAGSEYYIEVNRRVETVKKVKSGFLFFKSTKNKRVTHDDVKQLNVFVPEMPTGPAIYDEDDQKRFNKPFRALGWSDFSKEVTGILVPYSKVETNDFSFKDYLVPGVINGASKFFQAIGGRRYLTNVVPVANNLFWNDFYKINQRYMVGAPLIKFRKHSTRPLFEADRADWGRHILAKFNNVRSVLDQMFAQSENGYKFRMHSDAYGVFKANYNKMATSMQAVLDLKNEGTTFLHNSEAQRILKAYPQIVGDRPDSLESAIEMTMAMAPTEIKKLLAESVKFGNVKDVDSYNTSELVYLTKEGGRAVLENLGRRDSTALTKNLVALYMNGKEDVVREIFQTLSNHILKKITSINTKLTNAKNSVFTAMNNTTSIDLKAQRALIAKGKKIIMDAIKTATKPDNYSKEEEFKSLKGTIKTSINIKKIYRSIDTVQMAQQILRHAFGSSKVELGKLLALYKENPTLEIREELIDFFQFYNSKMKEMDAEFWPYKKYGEARVVGWTTNDDGSKKPLVEQDWSVDELELFNQPQEVEYAVTGMTDVSKIEYIYMSSHLEKIYLALEKDAIAIGEVYREFTEYPSHSVSVALKVSLEDFSKLRRSINTKLATYRTSEYVEDSTKINNLISKFRESVAAINWVNEADDSGKSPAKLIKDVEALRDQYNDLLIPVTIH